MIVRRLGIVDDPLESFGPIAGDAGAFFIDGGAAPLTGEPDRWSYFGSSPFAVVTSGHLEPDDPFDALERAIAGHRREPGEIPFAGGAVGYLSYDLKHRIERLSEPAAPRECDDLWFGLHDAVGAWNVSSRELVIVATGAAEAGTRAAAERAIDVMHRRLESGARPAGPGISEGVAGIPEGVSGGASGWRAGFTREEDRAAVRQLKEFIGEGEIYQANLSQRFESLRPSDPWELWRALRETSPAPYSAFLRCGGLEILSASPERFLTRSGERVETRPIKGTRPRGGDQQSDARLAAELRASPKDGAEHVMIVDLERNDLSRVCRPGSVLVPSFRALESWAQVHHLVSIVEGRLRSGIGLAELLRATFPGGSITGAPKIRAMQILDRIEPVRRGPYCGAAGWIGWSGDLDLQIAIRTLYRQDGRLWYQVGGGIVADSDPEAEYEETLVKGRAISGLFSEEISAEGPRMIL